MNEKTDWTDDELRRALFLRDAHGFSYRMVGDSIGRSKNSVIGMFNRIRKASDDIPCQCKKPENKDGGMFGKVWWDCG